MATPWQRRKINRTKSVAQFAQSLSETEIQVMKELFDLCDGDGDGQISSSELKQVMDELGLTVSKDEFDILFRTLDTNNDQKISFGDFLSGFRWVQKSMRISASGSVPTRTAKPQPPSPSSSPSSPSQASSPTSSPTTKRQQPAKSVTEFLRQAGDLNESAMKRMKELFQECDENKNGSISKRELWNFLHKQGVEPSKEEFLSLFSELDEDNQGSLTFKQFVKGIQGLSKGLYLSFDAPNPQKQQSSPKQPRQAVSTNTATSPGQRKDSNPVSRESPRASPRERRDSNPTSREVPSRPQPRGKPQLMRRGTILELVQKPLTKEELNHLKELFRYCDKDSNGSIDKTELASVFKELGVKASQEEFENLFHKLAVSNTNAISFDDFVNGLQWLNKGLVLSDSFAGTSAKKATKEAQESSETQELKDRIKELEKTNDILLSYLRDFVGRVTTRAERECSKDHIKAGSALMELLDYPLVREMESFVGGKLTTPEQDESIARIQKYLSAGRKK